MANDVEPLYRRDGDRFVPSGHTRGPWDPDAQHAGAPAALLAGLIAQLAGDGMRVARLTFEIRKPVPIEPCTVELDVTRPGKRVVGIAGTLRAAGVDVITVAAAALRSADLQEAATADEPPPFGAPEEGTLGSFAHEEAGLDLFHQTGMEVRAIAGGFETGGPGRAWFRLARPVVDADPPTPLQRLAAAADFANGISWVLDPATHLFVNVDLTVQSVRDVDGEWVALDAVTWIGPDGAGIASAVAYDRRGVVGRSAQTLFVAPRTALG